MFDLGQYVLDRPTGLTGVIIRIEENRMLPHLSMYHVDHGDHVNLVYGTRLTIARPPETVWEDLDTKESVHGELEVEPPALAD